MDAAAKSATSVQEVPSYFYVLARADSGGGAPPKAKAEVVVPFPPSVILNVFKSLTSVQVDPFHFSVIATAVPVVPPKHKAAVLVPAPAFQNLSVVRPPVAVQDVPFQV